MARGANLSHTERMDHPRISSIPGVMSGKPCIRGTRVPVDLILDYLASGETVSELLLSYPTLTEDDVRAAIAFAADHIRTSGFVSV